MPNLWKQGQKMLVGWAQESNEADGDVQTPILQISSLNDFTKITAKFIHMGLIPNINLQGGGYMRDRRYLCCTYA